MFLKGRKVVASILSLVLFLSNLVVLPNSKAEGISDLPERPDEIGFLVNQPVENQVLTQNEILTFQKIGNWTYISVKKGMENELNLVRKNLQDAGFQIFENLELKNEFDPDPNNPLNRYDGTELIDQDWYFKLVGLNSESLLPIINSSTKPKACVIDTSIDLRANEFLRRISEKSYNFLERSKSTFNVDFYDTNTVTRTAVPSILLKGLGENAKFVEYIQLVSSWRLNNGTATTEFHLATSINYGTEIGCNVFIITIATDFESEIIDDAINYAKNRGSVFIISAGDFGGEISYPANKHADIIVGAIDRSGKVTNFTNTPHSSDELSRFVLAPGSKLFVDTLRTSLTENIPLGNVFSGTSFATPLVAALVLNEMLHHPLTAQQAVEKVLLSAHSQGTEMESWIPYASNANRIPQISNISVVPGVVTNSGTIRVVAKVTGNTTEPLLVNYESGREVSLAKMVSLRNGYYFGEMVVENLFQTRYKKLWVKAENDFGSYMALTPSFLMIGNLIEDRPTIRFNGRPRIGRVITFGINWNGKYDYAFISASYGNTILNIRKIITDNEQLSIKIDCGQSLHVSGQMVSGNSLYEVSDSLAFENPSDCPNWPNSFSIVSNPKMSLNTNHYVYAPSYILGRIKWTITTDPLMPNFQSIEVYDGNALNLKDKLTNLKLDDKIYVHATAVLPEGTYYSNSEEITVISEELKIQTYYDISVPFVRN